MASLQEIKILCHRCPYLPESQHDLKMHLAKEHGESRLPCPICSSELAFTSFHNHLKAVHEKTAKYSPSLPWKCHLCHFEARLVAGLASHHKSEHSDALMTCSLCPAVVRPQSMNGHLRGTHGAKKFPCAKCDYRAATEAALRNHQMSLGCGGSMVQCPQCDKELTEQSLPNHIRATHMKLGGGKSVQCPICQKVLAACSLQRHITRVHTRTTVSKCDQCDFESFHPGSLRNHKAAIHRSESNYNCDLCPYKSYYSAAVRKHISNVHLGVKSHLCQICQKSFGTPSDISRHRRQVHLKTGLSQCDACEKTLAPSSLNAHKRRVHGQEKIFTCSICGHESRSAGDLRRHVLVKHQAADGATRCPVNNCDFKTVHKNTLAAHVRSVHEGIRDQKCPQCKYVSGYKSNLRRHIDQTHNRIKRSVCPTCEKRFWNNEERDRHIRGHHLLWN